MIVDHIENADLYLGLSEDIAKGLDYLRNTDFTNVEDGRVDLNGDRIFALVQRYRTRSEAKGSLESHRKYLDIQFIAKGTERIGYCSATAKPSVTKPYDPETDAAFYDGVGNLVELQEGCFAIYWPQDLHAPQIAAGSPPVPGDVIKVVVKVQVG